MQAVLLPVLLICQHKPRPQRRDINAPQPPRLAAGRFFMLGLGFWAQCRFLMNFG